MVPLDQGVGVKARLWGGRALAVVVTLAFLGSALSKLVHVAKVVEGLTKSGIPQGAIVPIGLLEIACLALYLFPRTSILGTFLLTGYIGGAIVTHIIGRQSLVPPLIVGFLMFAAVSQHKKFRRESDAERGPGVELSFALVALLRKRVIR
jgi:hypothetical protein